MNIRSILAIAAGLAVVIALTMGTAQVLVHLHYFPPLDQYNSFSKEMLIVATAYSCVYAALGGYLTARLAPQRAMLHVLILGLIGTALSLFGAITMWSKVDQHWYPVALTIGALPFTLLGGLLGRGRGR